MHALPDRVGGRLCLDFVNTVDPRTAGAGTEYLPDYQSVLDWFAATDTSLPRNVAWLRRRANADSRASLMAYEGIIAMREALYGVIVAAIEDRTVRPAELSRVNDALGKSIGHRVLAPSDRGGVREEWRTSDSLEQVLWPVAIDAWDLLTEPELVRVRQCPVDSGGCGWLFLDESRSGNRRWCDMRTCGNRAKARAHYSRNAG